MSITHSECQFFVIFEKNCTFIQFLSSYVLENYAKIETSGVPPRTPTLKYMEKEKCLKVTRNVNKERKSGIEKISK